eukprot:Pgem_evm1s1583
MTLNLLIFINNPVFAQPTNSNNDCLSSHQTGGCRIKECQDKLCANDSFCCDTQWDNICAEDAVEEFVCACPGPDQVIARRDNLFANYYYLCNYNTNSHDLFACPSGTKFITSSIT